MFLKAYLIISFYSCSFEIRFCLWVGVERFGYVGRSMKPKETSEDRASRMFEFLTATFVYPVSIFAGTFGIC